MLKLIKMWLKAAVEETRRAWSDGECRVGSEARPERRKEA